MPGDRPYRDDIQRMIRVDQAGEYGAVQIYKGQLAVLGRSDTAPLLLHMLKQEEEHLGQFNKILIERHVRPTVLSPLWQIMGFALGAGTAMLGKKAAMACTVAVEEVIDDHYAKQQAKLGGNQDPELEKLIIKCREEENEHKQTGLAHGAQQTPGYPLLSGAIKTMSRIAIWLSTRM